MWCCFFRFLFLASTDVFAYLPAVLITPERKKKNQKGEKADMKIITYNNSGTTKMYYV